MYLNVFYFCTFFLGFADLPRSWFCVVPNFGGFFSFFHVLFLSPWHYLSGTLFIYMFYHLIWTHRSLNRFFLFILLFLSCINTFTDTFPALFFQVVILQVHQFIDYEHLSLWIHVSAKAPCLLIPTFRLLWSASVIFLWEVLSFILKGITLLVTILILRLLNSSVKVSHHLLLF